MPVNECNRVATAEFWWLLRWCGGLALIFRAEVTLCDEQTQDVVNAVDDLKSTYRFSPLICSTKTRQISLGKLEIYTNETN